jgi:murein DD-endopeptidase MepM/ murein hydrolase activator NlpD
MTRTELSRERARAALAVLAGAVVLAAGGPAPAPAAATALRPAASPPSAGPAAIARTIAEDAPLPVIFGEEGTDAAEAAPPSSPTVPGERLIDGPMEQVLYKPNDPTAAQALGLLGHMLDLTRDLALGDRVRLLERSAPGGGVRLDYVEVEGLRSVRLYRRLDGKGARTGDFADATGAPLERFLLRTPLAVTRITSGFGLRRHPLLGYTRAHRGVDFAAAPGTPVFAAADGEVEAAGWAGGYGQRIRLRHAGGLETLYAHLSAWSPQAAAGRTVRQGQVIGWTGASGLATGPHLHFEVIAAGQAIDPALARPAAPLLTAHERQAFQALKSEIDRRLAQPG